MHSSRGPMRLSKLSMAGFSLVELMVAMALSLLLLAGVVAIFSSSRVAYESTDQLSRVQETGRFALDQLSRHIRSAGFSGCSRQPTAIASALNADTTATLEYAFMDSPPVLGYDSSGSGSWSPALHPTIQGLSPAEDSDVLVVRGARLDVVPMQVTQDMVGDDGITLDATGALLVKSAGSANGIQPGAGNVLMAYSCEAVSFFFANASGNQLIRPIGENTIPGNVTNSTSYPFLKAAEVVPVETVIYYVDQASAPAPEGMNSLWRKVGETNPEELVQGVERMQIEYGVDMQGDRVVDEYRPAGTVANWDRVVSVRIAMLVSSVQEYGNDRDERTYQLLDTEVPPPRDRRLRDVFTTTVGIRNRVRIE
nr:PilW family protein [uncultured Steroidobacter sp.]